MGIDHRCTDNIVCPYCGYEDSDSWEEQPGEEDLGLIECGSCDKSFYAQRNITITYFTQKARYGTCRGCGAGDVPIENLTSTIGCYEDLCVECGAKEQQKLTKEYLDRIV